MDAKNLSTAAVLTITTGIVMVEGFAGVGEAFEWIMGHPVWTHEMPRFGDAARDRVVAQYPDIPVAATAEDWRSVRDAAIERYGETISITQGDEERKVGPMTSLAQAMRGDA